MKMADKKQIGCGTIVAGAIFAGMALSYAATFALGYAIRGCNAENTETCHQRIAPLRKKFRENCEGKLYDNVNQSALETITAERNQIQKELGCEKEKWVCRPVDPYRVQESKTQAVYKLK